MIGMLSYLYHRFRSWVTTKPQIVTLAKRIYKSQWLNNQPLFQNWILNRAKRLHETKGDKPEGIFIETTLTCNAKCIMCVHSQRKMVGEMDYELFERLIDETAELGIDIVGLSVYGEPFADRKFMKRVEKVRSKDMRFGFFSNASLMLPEKVDRLLELGGWENVNFSVNGFSTAVYEKVMPPLKRDKAYNNIEYLLQAKKRLGVSLPHVTVSCVQTQENYHEIDDFLQYWQGRPGVDRVVIADCGDWLGALEDDGTIATEKTRGVDDSTWQAPCRALWGSLYIYSDGRVSPCCEDSASRNLIIGNVSNSTIMDIFRGQIMTELREQHLENKRHCHEVCGECRWNVPWV